MKHTILYWTVALLVVLSLSCVAACRHGSQYPQIPVVSDSFRWVSDYSDVFTPVQIDTLEALVDDVSNTSGAQIAIVIVDSLSGLSAREYSKASPDEEVSSIIQEDMIPRIKDVDVYSGTKDALDALTH